MSLNFIQKFTKGDIWCEKYFEFSFNIVTLRVLSVCCLKFMIFFKIYNIQNMVQQDSTSSDQIENQSQQKNALSRDFRDENTYSEVILKFASQVYLKLYNF